MNSTIDVDILLNQCENYMNENDIMNLMKQCLHKLCIHQPDNPIQFLKQYFANQQYDQVREYFKIIAIQRLCWHLVFSALSGPGINDLYAYSMFSMLVIVKTKIFSSRIQLST
jgi:hypothetical protein